jgi:hypothetical protein
MSMESTYRGNVSIFDAILNMKRKNVLIFLLILSCFLTIAGTISLSAAVLIGLIALGAGGLILIVVTMMTD